MASAAGIRRVMVLAKRSAYDMYVARHQDPTFTRFLSEPQAMQVVANLSRQHENESIQVVGNLQDRHIVHEQTVRTCRDILSRRQADIQFEMHLRDELQSPIRDVDLVITVGGDGTLLQASHYLDSSIPVLGVNSDPTQTDEVEQNLHRFDASRSTGHLCAATANNFERILDDILHGSTKPVELTRISTFIDGVRMEAPALNDVLIAHPNPAAISRCSFSITREGADELLTPVVHSRSSGLRVSTATGSTAAMKSAGGTVMPILSTKLQYMASCISMALISVILSTSDARLMSRIMHLLYEFFGVRSKTWISNARSLRRTRLSPSAAYMLQSPTLLTVCLFAGEGALHADRALSTKQFDVFKNRVDNVKVGVIATSFSSGCTIF